MSELDDTIRDGLTEATEGAGEIEPADLAERLRERRGFDTVDGPGPSRSWPRNRWLTAAAMLLLLGGVAGFAIWSTARDNDTNIIATKPAPTKSGFDGWEPGWHEIDPGPVPVTSRVSMAWLDDRLFVAGTRFTEPGTDPETASNSGVWAFDPVDRQWSTLPALPFEAVSLVAAGDRLVAVGNSGTGLTTQPINMTLRWATWTPKDSEWTDRGEVPLAPQFRTFGVTGPSERNGDESLVWTGERVLDLTRGAVLDPSTGAATGLSMPDDLSRYSHLMQATPVWTGTEVVVATWSLKPGLAWDALGREHREIPGPPRTYPNQFGDSAAFSVEGRVVLVGRSDSDTGRTASYDPATGQWTELPPVPTTGVPWCWYKGATVDNELIVQACQAPEGVSDREVNQPLAFRRGKWRQIPRPPRSEQGIETWLGTAKALIVWSGDNDTFNKPAAPYRWAAVWIPEPSGNLDPVDPVTPSRPSVSSTPDSPTETTLVVPTSPPTTTAARCTVDELPDLGPALPAVLDTGPNPGVGGTDNSEGCYRHWGSSRDQGTHLTQYPGPSLFGNVSETGEGDFAWFDIEDGFAVEYRGQHPWAANVYGISSAEFNEFVQSLLVDPARYETAGSQGPVMS